LHRKRTRFYHKRSTPQSGREDNLSEPQYCLDLFPKHLPGFDKAQTRVEFFCRFILRLIANPSGMDTLIGPKNLQHLFHAKASVAFSLKLIGDHQAQNKGLLVRVLKIIAIHQKADWRVTVVNPKRVEVPVAFVIIAKLRFGDGIQIRGNKVGLIVAHFQADQFFPVIFGDGANFWHIILS